MRGDVGWNRSFVISFVYLQLKGLRSQLKNLECGSIIICEMVEVFRK